MKNLLIAFLLLAGMSFHSRAQYVAIPDTNFGTWLNTNGYSSCLLGDNIVGWQMDTTCPAVLNANFMNCSAKNIRNLTGIQYFDSLTWLYCISNQLTSLPPLPKGLTNLNCYSNQLTGLPALPNGLTDLNCYNNQLTSLPALPSNLNRLYVSTNQLTALPALPASLEYLDVSHNQFTSLPTLPDSLILLYCPNNRLTSLPSLPNTLYMLNCTDNQLTSLPSLPPGLTDFDCKNNLLTGLPSLPNNLSELDASNNRLTSLPTLITLNGTVRFIDVSYNQLTSLPALPPINNFVCSHNQITVLPALPGGMLGLMCDNNLLTTLPVLPTSLINLNASNNRISSLPNMSNNNHLTDLGFANNLLTTLPALPPAFFYLNVSHNQLTALPALYPYMTILYCGNNLLTSLPFLPTNLRELYCSHNQLSSLPSLPANLQILRCDSNQLNSLPALPASLGFLDCQYNQISSITSFSAKMRSCYVSNNPLTCLPKLTKIDSLFFVNTQVSCVPNYGIVKVSSPDVQSMNQCVPGNPNGCSFYSYHVVIPDSQFGLWLGNNGFGGCVQWKNGIGWMMDTTCSAVVSATTLNISNTPIKDLTGIQYFDNLQYLYCVGNEELTYIPAFPNTLKYFTCYGGLLTSLPPLPGTLSQLECINNQLTSLPTLPNGLTSLNCSYNPLGVLPVLPGSLTDLSCSNNLLTSLPSILPNGLQWLTCSFNQLSSLPALPGNLGHLDCSNNQLTNLPSIYSLWYLNCSNNQLTVLPTFPPLMAVLVISNNPIACLPVLDLTDSLIFTNTLITCKSGPVSVYYSRPDIGTLPSCAPGNPNGCAVDTLCINFKIDTIITTNVSCHNGNNGNACAIASGGAPPYSYDWNYWIGQTQCVSNLVRGTYAVTVTDTNGCARTETVTITEPAPLTLTIVRTGNGFFPDTLEVLVTGGCPPYTYMWSTGNNNSQIMITTSGTYGLTVTDNCGCTISDSILISGLIADAGRDTTICLGEVVLLGGNPPASGGAGGYTFMWVPAVSLSCSTCPNPAAAPVVTTHYLLFATDSLGALAIDTVVVYVNQGPQIDSITISNVSCFGGNDGSACVHVSAGIPPYTYSWSSWHTTDCATDLPAGTHTVAVTDNYGCSVSDHFDITVPPQLIAQFVYTSDGVIPDTVFCYVAGGTPFMSTGTSTYIVDWGDGGTSTWDTSANIYNAEGIYNPSVTDSNGCQVRDTLTLGCLASCVWPGDADYNGRADNYDLLPIGLAYGTTGISRLQQDINWYGHVAQDWTDTLLSGTNYKHIDCDGNGAINGADTLAILQNFMLTHAKRSGQRNWRMIDPALQVDLVPDTTQAGDTMYANLTLGDMNIPANDVYGMAFTINYDAMVVDTSKTTIAFGNSWLGTTTDKISIAKDLKPSGQLKCALTRIDHATRSGYGQIGQATFIITTDNINGKDAFAYYQLNVWISDLVLIDNLGNIISVNEGSDSSQVEFEPVGVGEIGIKNDELRIYPNPASGDVQLLVSERLVGGEMKLLDITGRVLFRRNLITGNSQLATGNLGSGIYLVQAVTQKGVLTKRLVITR